MKRRSHRNIFAAILIVGTLLIVPIIIYAQPGDFNNGSPPIAQRLIREGDFAVRLESALELGNAEDEMAAENDLGDKGIVPRNGWIADYPVTPDILTELQKSISDAANADKLPIDKDEALQRFHDLTAKLNLPVKPYSANQGHEDDS